ncbi:MAG: tetratricopeptide repeat protein [Hyphomonadaceae bacterium]|nr:tetratricopeptide repeat protein [Hyphomonadaceae bacterium]
MCPRAAQIAANEPAAGGTKKGRYSQCVMWGLFKRRKPKPDASSLREVIDTHGPESRETFIAMAQLSERLRHEGVLGAAKEVGLQALEGMRRLFGLDAEDTLIASLVLAHTLLVRGEHAEALALAEHVVEVKVRTLGPTHPETYDAMDVVEAIRIDAGMPPPDSYPSSTA